MSIELQRADGCRQVIHVSHDPDRPGFAQTLTHNDWIMGRAGIAYDLHPCAQGTNHAGNGILDPD
eukprot:gene51869-69421_t